MSRPGQSYEPPLWAWNVGSIVAEICDRAGVPFDRYETDLIEGAVEGFYNNNRQPCSTAISALAKIFLFDMSNHSGLLHFVPRGGVPVAQIDLEDLIASNQAYEQLSRHDAIRVPRLVTLEYYDSDGGLTTDQQISDRTQDDRSVQDNKETTTVIMRANDAARAAVIRHKIIIEEARGEMDFSLPESYIGLSVADVIMFGSQRMRVTSIDMDDGYQKYKATFDRVSAYQSEITGLPIVPPSTPPDLVVDDTVVEFIDSHILRDSQDRLGYYVAVSGEGLNWSGALVELSRDGGENWIEGAGTIANATIGQLADTLPAGPVHYPDDINYIEVSLLRDDMELIDATFTEVLNRSNLCIVGDELINFQHVEQTSDGTWILRGLLRGRKGTASVPHSVGERFVMMESNALTFVYADLFDLGRELTFRATSLGADASSDTITETYTGQSQVERMPAYLAAVKDDTDLIVSWQGVGRLGGGASIGMGQHFVGYRVTLGSHTEITIDQSVTIPYSTGTLAVTQVNEITGDGPAAELEIA